MGQEWNIQVGKIIPAGYSPYTKTAQNVYAQYQRVLAIHKNAPKRVRSVPSKHKRKQNSICRSVFLVDYHTELSNYYAFYARLVRLTEYLERRGIRINLCN